MTRGTVTDYDPQEEEGYIAPDDQNDRIPFDRKSLIDFAHDEDPKTGDRVSFHVEGGMAGLWAVKIRRID